MNPNLTHSGGKLNKTPKFMAINPAKKPPACFGDSSPVVKGLALVLSTCLSISLSAKSLIMHPADLQLKAPRENRAIIDGEGIKPGDPKANPQKHGKSNKCVPIYR